jgi:hypothetical protein
MTPGERAAELLKERLRNKRCQLWPACSCYEQLLQWRKNLIDDDETIWRLDQLEWMETSIFVCLACVVKYCPDKVVRASARKAFLGSAMEYVNP